MKKLKTLISVMLCAMLVLSLVVPAMADTDASTITVLLNDEQKQEAGETYTAYKIFNLEYSGELGVYTLPEESPFNNVAGIAKLAEFGFIVSLTEVGNDNCKIVELDGDLTEAQKETNAKAFAEYLNDYDFDDYAFKSSADTIAEEGKTTKAVIDVSSLGAGYYFVDTTTGSTCVIHNIKGENTEIVDKNTDVTVEKIIVNDDNNKENSVQIGDTVYFETTVNIPVGAENVRLHDKMDTGFDFAFTLKDAEDKDVDNIQIEGLTKGVDYTVNENPSDDCTFEIVFTDNWLLSKKATGATVTVTYSAVLNSEAEVLESKTANNKNDNETYATFGAGQKSNVEYTHTTTAWFVLNKVIKGTNTLLADAEFELYIDGEEEPLALLKSDDGLTYTIADDNDENTVNKIISTATGKITINGLDEEVVYKLKETDAPVGYNKILELQTVNEFSETKVENGTGTELPSTGGMGTKILFTVGGIMMVVAFVLFTSKRRMAAED